MKIRCNDFYYVLMEMAKEKSLRINGGGLRAKGKEGGRMHSVEQGADGN